MPEIPQISPANPRSDPANPELNRRGEHGPECRARHLPQPPPVNFSCPATFNAPFRPPSPAAIQGAGLISGFAGQIWGCYLGRFDAISGRCPRRAADLAAHVLLP